MKPEFTKMRDLAIALMQDNYKAADNAAKAGRLAQAAAHLETAEKWRVTAREEGARV